MAFDVATNVIGADDHSLGIDQVCDPSGEKVHRVTRGAFDVEQRTDLPVGVGEKGEVELHHVRPTLVVLWGVVGDPDDASVELFELRSSITELRTFEGSASRVGLHIPPQDCPTPVPLAAGDRVPVVVDRAELWKGGSRLEHSNRG